MESKASPAEAIKLAQFGETDRLREMLNLYPQFLQSAKDWVRDTTLTLVHSLCRVVRRWLVGHSLLALQVRDGLNAC